MIRIQACLVSLFQRIFVLAHKRTRTARRVLGLAPLLCAVSLVVYSPRVITAAEPVESTERLEQSQEVLPAALPESLSNVTRDYRIEVYRAFRLDRAEFDRRRQVAEDTVDAWRTSRRRGAQESDQDLKKLTKWFSEATASLLSGERGSPPAPPTLGVRSAKPTRRALTTRAPILDPSAFGPSAGLTPRVAPEPGDPTPVATPPRTQSVVPPARVVVAPAIVLRVVPEPARSAPEPDARDRSDSSVSTSSPTVVKAIVEPRQAQKSETSERSARINLSELSARIRGWNLALMGIENRALSNATPSIDEISKSVNDLQALLQRRRTVALYLSILEPRQIDQVGQLESFEAAIELVLLRWKATGRRQAKPSLSERGDSTNASTNTVGGETDLLESLGRLSRELKQATR